MTNDRKWDTPPPPKQPWAKPKPKHLPDLQHLVSGQPVLVLSPRHMASLTALVQTIENEGVRVPGHAVELVDLLARLCTARSKTGAGRMTRAELNNSGVRDGTQLAVATSAARAANVGVVMLPTISKAFLVGAARLYVKQWIAEHGPETAHAMALETSFVLHRLLTFNRVKCRGDEIARLGASVGMTHGSVVACFRRLRDLGYITLETGQDEDGTQWYLPSVVWESIREARIRGDATKGRLDRELMEYELGLRVDAGPTLPSVHMTAGERAKRKAQSPDSPGLFSADADTNLGADGTALDAVGSDSHGLLHPPVDKSGKPVG